MPNRCREYAGDKPEWSDVLALLSVRERVAKHEPKVRERIDERVAKHEPKVRERISAISSNTQKHPKRSDRIVYGDHIDFRGLRHAPVNENGVIFLFGIVASELGYSVEAVQAGFPDCEAKQQTGTGQWQRVRIEFEFASRNFLDHGHSADGCDVIVCWKHNWADCPDDLEVVELSEVIKQLPKSEE